MLKLTTLIIFATTTCITKQVFGQDCEVYQNKVISGSGSTSYGYFDTPETCCAFCKSKTDCVGWEHSNRWCKIKTSFQSLQDSQGTTSGLLISAECVSNACKNDGACAKGGVCECAGGYTGPTCETAPVLATDRPGKMHSQVRDRLIQRHNDCRQAVGLGQVAWDDDLETFAMTYQNQLASVCQGLTHSSSTSRTNITNWIGKYAGENLASGTTWEIGFSVEKQLLRADSSVNMWCGEKQWYTYETNTCTPEKVCGHYTQVVWQESTKIGCGIALCEGGKRWYVGCNYQAGGNINNRKPY